MAVAARTAAETEVETAVMKAQAEAAALVAAAAAAATRTVAASACAGKSLRDIAEENPETYIKFHKGIQDYKAKMTQPRCASTPRRESSYRLTAGTGIVTGVDPVAPAMPVLTE